MKFELELSDRQADELMAEAEAITYFHDLTLKPGAAPRAGRESRRRIFQHIFETLQDAGCYGLNAVLHVTYRIDTGERVQLSYCPHGTMLTSHCAMCEDTPEG